MDFFEAVKNNNIDLVKKYIREGFDPSHVDNEAISIASEEGHVEILQLLLDDPRVNPNAQYNTPIYIAAYYGRTECVRSLLLDGRADPTIQNNVCLFYALTNRNYEVAKLLLRDDRVSSNIKYDNYFRDKEGIIRKLKSEIRDDKIDEHLSQ
jgi:ankyrin repeat protein